MMMSAIIDYAGMLTQLSKLGSKYYEAVAKITSKFEKGIRNQHM